MSREDELALPDFGSAEEAFEHFKDMFGADFEFQGFEMVDGQECWFCHLVIDRGAYDQGMRTLKRGKPVTGMDFPMSYQPVEIFESGHIHIVH